MTGAEQIIGAGFIWFACSCTLRLLLVLFLLLFLAFLGKMASRQKERALTSPKTSALAFISVLPWRINDGQILTGNSQR